MIQQSHVLAFSYVEDFNQDEPPGCVILHTVTTAAVEKPGALLGASHGIPLSAWPQSSQQEPWVALPGFRVRSYCLVNM